MARATIIRIVQSVPPPLILRLEVRRFVAVFFDVLRLPVFLLGATLLLFL